MSLRIGKEHTVLLRKGSEGDEVSDLQMELNQLGFDLDVNGTFDSKMHQAVITLQTIFGYDVDGIVGPATRKLIRQQTGYGWNLVAARKAFVTDEEGEEDEEDEE